MKRRTDSSLPARMLRKWIRAEDGRMAFIRFWQEEPGDEVSVSISYPAGDHDRITLPFSLEYIESLLIETWCKRGQPLSYIRFRERDCDHPEKEIYLSFAKVEEYAALARLLFGGMTIH